MEFQIFGGLKLNIKWGPGFALGYTASSNPWLTNTDIDLSSTTLNPTSSHMVGNQLVVPSSWALNHVKFALKHFFHCILL